MDDRSDLSITRWIHRLAEGDHAAAGHLWGILKQQLLRLAQRNVSGKTSTYDEEDVANSAFGELCQGIEFGRYDRLSNRGDLWRLLAVITVNKARRKARDESRLKRGGGFTRESSDVLEVFPSAALSPEVEIACNQECERLLSMLGSEETKTVAMLKVEGYKNSEIAQQMKCTYRTVQRRLSVIRQIWSHEV